MKSTIDSPVWNGVVSIRILGKNRVVARHGKSGLPHFPTTSGTNLIGGKMRFQGQCSTFQKVDDSTISATCHGSTGTLIATWKLNRSQTEWTPKFMFKWNSKDVPASAQSLGL